MKSLFLIITSLLFSNCLFAQWLDRQLYTSSSGRIATADLIDLNGDGIKDYLIQGIDETGYLKGLPGGNFSDLVLLNGTFVDGLLTVVDIDNDSDLDIVGYGNDRLVIFLQDSPNNYTEVSNDLNRSRVPEYLTVADLNNDGHTEYYLGGTFEPGIQVIQINGQELEIDTIIAPGVKGLYNGSDDNGSYLAIAYDTDKVARVALENTGNYQIQSSSGNTKTSYIETYDLDADGYDDLIQVTDFRAYVARGNAQGIWSTPIEVARVGGNRNVEILDVDQDGRKDLVFGNYSLYDVKIAQQGTNFNWTEQEVDFPIRSYLSFEIVSFDNGDFDVIVDGQYYKDGLSNPKYDRTIFSSTIRILDIVLEDFSGDGVSDILINKDIQNRFQLLQSFNGAYSQSTTLDPTFGNTSFEITDLNGDGNLDVVFIEDDAMRWFPGLGNGQFQSEQPLLTFTDNNWQFAGQGDLDNDGDQDLIISGEDDKIRWLERSGSTYRSPQYVYDRPDGRERAFRIDLVDVDNDGDKDMVAVDFWSGVELIKNNAGTFSAATQYISNKFHAGDFMTLDLNGDEYIDFVGLNTYLDGTSQVELYINEGGDNVTKGATIYNSTNVAEGLAKKDYNGDGILDIIVADEEGNRIFTLLRRSDGSFSDPILIDEVPSPARILFDQNSDLAVVLCEQSFHNDSRLYTYKTATTNKELDVIVSNEICHDNGTQLDISDDYRSFEVQVISNLFLNDQYIVEIPQFNILDSTRVGNIISIDLPEGSAEAGSIEVRIFHRQSGVEELHYIIADQACSDPSLFEDIDALMIIFEENGGATWRDDITFDNDPWEASYTLYKSNPEDARAKGGCHLPGVVCDQDQRVTELNLSNIRMKNDLSAAIGILTELERLDVGRNQLSSLPASIANLKKLVYLNWQWNEMTGEIQSAIGECTALEEIIMGLNRMEGPIPESFGQLTKLQKLIVNSGATTAWFSAITSLPESIGNCTDLEEISMWNCQFDSPLPESIGNLVKMKVLNLSNSGIPGEIPNSISNMKQLEWLTLDRNYLTGRLPDSLHLISNPALDVISLGSNQLDGCIPNKYSVLCGTRIFSIGPNLGQWIVSDFCANGDGACGQDNDMDGFISPEDCDDEDASINPSMEEIPFNAADENCDGIKAERCYQYELDAFRDASALEEAHIVCDRENLDFSTHKNAGRQLDLLSCENNIGIAEAWFVSKLVSDGSFYFGVDSYETPVSFEVYKLDTFPFTSSMDLVRCYNSTGLCFDQIYVGLSRSVADDLIEGEGCDQETLGFLADIQAKKNEFHAVRVITELEVDDELSIEFCGEALLPQSDLTCEIEFMWIDQDMDGYSVEEDCDDEDPSIYPDAIDIGFNDIDENCDDLLYQPCTSIHNTNHLFITARHICDKTPIVIEDWTAPNPETNKYNCKEDIDVNGQHVVFLKVKIKEAGSFYFKLSSEVANKQINFSVFKMSNDFDLSTLEQIRCIYSGTNYSTSDQSECHSSTGLTPNEIDDFEEEGCSGNGFGAAIDALDDDEYLILVRSNNRRTAPVLVEWCGTALLMGEEEGAECVTDFVTLVSQELIEEVQFYPNPAQDELTINVKGKSPETVELISVSGKSKFLKTQDNKVDLSQMTTGMYIVRFWWDDGKHFLTQKVFIQ